MEWQPGVRLGVLRGCMRGEIRPLQVQLVRRWTRSTSGTDRSRWRMPPSWNRSDDVEQDGTWWSRWQCVAGRQVLGVCSATKQKDYMDDLWFDILKYLHSEQYTNNARTQWLHSTLWITIDNSKFDDLRVASFIKLIYKIFIIIMNRKQLLVYLHCYLKWTLQFS